LLYIRIENPFISNLKRFACASIQGRLVLTTMGYAKDIADGKLI
jgi:hypothetical protein